MIWLKSLLQFNIVGVSFLIMLLMMVLILIIMLVILYNILVEVKKAREILEKVE